MTSINLARKNIKKSYKDFTIYFLTLTIGVAIFYIFNSLESQNVMLEFNQAVLEMYSNAKPILDAISIFVSLILGFLIIYATNFLIKRRKQEFGIYLTLGMDKSKLSKILVFETFIVGLVSLALGITIGIILSHGMSLITANMFSVKLDEFKFVFSLNATIKTILYFSIIFVVVMIFNTFAVSKLKLIDLLNAHKQNEQLKNKNVILNVILFIISLIILAVSYYLVIEHNTDQMIIKISIVGGIIGTFLFFYSISGFILYIIRANKKRYYRGLNAFISRQFGSRINKTIVSTSIICLLLFSTIGILSTSASLSDVLNEDEDVVSPYDVSLLMYTFDEAEPGERADVLIENLDKHNVLSNFKEYMLFNLYETEINVFELIKIGDNTYPINLQVIKLSDYNKSLDILGMSLLELSDSEFYLTVNATVAQEGWSKFLAEDGTISLNGKEFTSKSAIASQTAVTNSYMRDNFGTIIINDQYVENLNALSQHFNAVYSDAINDYASTDMEITAKINDINNLGVTDYIILNSREGYINEALFSDILLTYIGLYIGMVFLIASSTIIALIQLSEVDENIERYKLLSKLGVSMQDMNHSILSSVAIGFFTPLSLALVHSVFGIWFSTKVLSKLGYSNLLDSVIFTAFILVLIYGSYFAVTYLGINRVVKKAI